MDIEFAFISNKNMIRKHGTTRPHCWTDQINISSVFDTWSYIFFVVISILLWIILGGFFICFGVSIWERNKNRSFRAYSLYKPNWLKLIHTWAELHMTECLPKQTDRNSFSQYFVGKWPLNFAVYWKWFTPNGRDVCKVQFNQNPLNKIQSLKRLEEASCPQNYIL